MGFSFPCKNISFGESACPHMMVSHPVIINMYFNHNSYITRKRWNKIMKMTNGNQPPNNKKKI